jgi:hypothetical protein
LYNSSAVVASPHQTALAERFQIVGGKMFIEFRFPL